MLIATAAQAALYSTISLLMFVALSLHGSCILGSRGVKTPVARFLTGLTALTVTRWFLFIAGASFYPNLIAFLINAALFATLSAALPARNKPTAANADETASDLQTYVAYFLASFIFLVCYLSKIPSGHLPLYTLGNNDLFYFLDVSNHLADPVNTVLGHPIDYIREIKGDVFGVFALIAFLSKITSNNTQTIPILLGTVSGLLAASSGQLMRRMGVTFPARLAACCIPAASPLLYYISGHFFIGQMLSWSVLLTGLDLILEGDGRRALVTGTVLYAFIWLFYPSYAIPMTLVLGVALAFQTWFGADEGASVTGLALLYARRAVLFLAAPAVLSLAATSPRVVSVLQMVESQATGSQGWPLYPLTYPFLSGLPAAQLDTARTSGLLPYAAAILAMASIALLMRKRMKNPAIHILAATYAFALAVCLTYSIMHEHSYRQWKLATFIAFPLWFTPIVALVRIISDRINARIGTHLLTAAATIILSLNVYITYNASSLYKNTFSKPITFTSDYALLKNINDSTLTRNVNLMMDAHSSTMLACDFLYKKRTALLSDSYYRKSQETYPPSGDTVFIQPYQCANKKRQDYTIGDLFLVSRDGFSQDNELTLGITYQLATPPRQSNCIIFSGFTINEFGSWADPPEASLRFHTPRVESGYTLALTGAGFTNTAFEPIYVNVLVNGEYVATWALTDIDTTSSITIPISNNYSSGQDTTITFITLNSHSPSELRIGESNKQYGLILHSITLK